MHITLRTDSPIIPTSGLDFKLSTQLPPLDIARRYDPKEWLRLFGPKQTNPDINQWTEHIYSRTHFSTSELRKELSRFSNFQDLSSSDQDFHIEFWQTCSQQWDFYKRHSETHKAISTLDALDFTTHVAKSRGYESTPVPAFVYQQMLWRKLLALEDSFEASCQGAKKQHVSVIITSTNNIPVQDIYTVDSLLLEKAFSLLLKAQPNLKMTPIETEALYKGAARLIAADKYQSRMKIKNMRQGYWLAKELYPGSTPIFWRRITILQALYKTLENPIQKNNLCVGTDFKSMVDELSKALHLPPIELVRELIDKPASCGLWAHYERESPIYQEALVKLAILFGSDLANTVYKKLHSEWAAWCDLSKAVDKEDAIVFYVRQGIGAVIDEARSARSWTYSQVAEKISVRLGKKYNYDDISAICTHVRQTSFEELKAIIDILNEDETAPKVSRTLALITRYPFLLVITGHVSNRPHIERKERSTLQFNTTQNHRLDPRGLPFLVRNRRFALGLDRRKAEEIFGMGTHIIDRVEADPSLDKVKNYPVGIELFQSILKMGIPLDQAIEAHEYSYWKNEPTLLTLRERSWTAPVFIDSRTLKRLRKFAEQPAGTFGEVLYAIRNSALPIYLSGKLRFPASPEDIGLFIGFPKTAWESWEQLRAEPSPDQISLILEKLNPSQEIRNKLSTKI